MSDPFPQPGADVRLEGPAPRAPERRRRHRGRALVQNGRGRRARRHRAPAPVARDASDAARAREFGALPARPRGATPSLSPASLLDLPASARLVLPSPNGATLAAEAGEAPVFAASLRSARAVAAAAARLGPRVPLVLAGERWTNALHRDRLPAHGREE